MSQYNLKAKDVTALKAKKVIIVLSEDTISSDIMKTAFEENWTFNREVLFKSESEAAELINSNPKDYYKIFLGIEKASMVTRMDGVYGPDIVISSTEYGSIPKFYIQGNEKNPLMALGLPSHLTFNSSTLRETVQRIQFVLNEIEIDGSWVKTFSKTKSEYIDELKTRTLLIPENLIDEENKKKIEERYKYKIEFVPQTTINEKIATKDKGYSYFVIIEEIVNVHIQYICNVEDSKILCHHHKMIQSSNTVKEGTKNLYLEASGFKKMTSKLK